MARNKLIAKDKMIAQYSSGDNIPSRAGSSEKTKTDQLNNRTRFFLLSNEAIPWLTTELNHAYKDNVVAEGEKIKRTTELDNILSRLVRLVHRAKHIFGKSSKQYHDKQSDQNGKRVICCNFRKLR